MGVAGTSEHVENSSCTMSDAEERKYGEVYEYLLNKSYPENSSKSDKLLIRRRSKEFQISDGQLQYVGHMKKKQSADPGSIQVICQSSMSMHTSYMTVNVATPLDCQQK